MIISEINDICTTEQLQILNFELLLDPASVFTNTYLPISG